MTDSPLEYGEQVIQLIQRIHAEFMEKTADKLDNAITEEQREEFGHTRRRARRACGW